MKGKGVKAVREGEKNNTMKSMRISDKNAKQVEVEVLNQLAMVSHKPLEGSLGRDKRNDDTIKSQEV
ncbi:conserved hypothetical protein [Ricinus communis]|uniref:Uncharacterized protein n=1 Tax=Ricinus communis TaxID=3988 RepID=B9RU63_RICCO|nr:conserved hypothetical protein [Ricinus communis]